MPGYVFYIHRGIPEINHLNSIEEPYTRVHDFGILPLLYIEGLPPNPHYDVNTRVRKILQTKNVPTEMIQSLFINKDTVSLYRNTNIPWHLIADKLVKYKININDVEKRLNKINTIDKNEVFFMENSNVGKQLLSHVINREIDRIELLHYMVSKLIKKDKSNRQNVNFESLYDYAYDCYELYLWHGTKNAIERLHIFIENLYRSYISRVTNELLSFTGGNLSAYLSQEVLKFNVGNE